MIKINGKKLKDSQNYDFWVKFKSDTVAPKPQDKVSFNKNVCLGKVANFRGSIA